MDRHSGRFGTQVDGISFFTVIPEFEQRSETNIRDPLVIGDPWSPLRCARDHG